MTRLRRWAATPLIPILAIALALLTNSCGPVTPSPVSATSSPPPAPSLTPVPGGSPAASASPVTVTVTKTYTDTEVGRIWDALPSSFPQVPGATPIEPGGGPTSGTFAVGTTVDDAVATIRVGLTNLGYSVDVGSPLEDGSVVLDAGGGEQPECRIEVRFTPLAGTTTIAVLYGAACPFS